MQNRNVVLHSENSISLHSTPKSPKGDFGSVLIISAFTSGDLGMEII